MTTINFDINIETANQVLTAIKIAESEDMCGEKASRFAEMLELAIAAITPPPQAFCGSKGGGDYTDHNF